MYVDLRGKVGRTLTRTLIPLQCEPASYFHGRLLNEDVCIRKISGEAKLNFLSSVSRVSKNIHLHIVTETGFFFRGQSSRLSASRQNTGSKLKTCRYFF
jgi:hypothetical protein